MLYTAIPSTYPRAGIYEYSTVHVDLACATSGAKIYYTLDGSEPSMESPVYCRAQGLIPLPALPDRETVYRIRAFAAAPGLERSPEAEYTFHIIGRKRGRFLHQLLREPSETSLGLIRIEDFDLDKMFLVIGSRRAVLIDAGWDSDGDLPGLCRDLTGGLPVDLVITHGHPDHVAQIPRFLAAGGRVYMPYADFAAASSFSLELPREKLLDIGSSNILDLGNGSLHVYTVPGHTPGGIVLLDQSTGDLFSSDAFGSNRRYVPDSAFLQLTDCSAEGCLYSLRAFRRETRGLLKRIYTGHNDEISEAEKYLDCLEAALSKAVSSGSDALSPSLRSASESFGSSTILAEGDWRLDPFWIAVNIRFLTEQDRTADPPRWAKGYALPA